MSFSAQALKMGEAEVPGPEVFWMSHWDQWVQLFYMIAVRGNGITLVVNTGPPADFADLNRFWEDAVGPRCQMKRLDDERPERALAEIGVDPAKVDFVLLTPLQSYAVANIALFPRAQICLSRRGWIEDIVARRSGLHVPRRVCMADPILHHLLFEGNDRLRLLEDEEEICSGIRAWWAGTHHPSSMVYSIESAAGAAMASDCAFKYANVAGHPLVIAESILEGETTYQRIRRDAAIFLPLYEPEVLERYPGGIVA